MHPALEVIAQEIGSDGVEHVDSERSESDRLFVVIVPGAAKAPSLIPHFLHQRIVLNDDGVFNERSGRRRSAVTTNSLVI